MTVPTAPSHAAPVTPVGIRARELRTALQDGQFRLAYQVQVDHRHRAIGAEGLLRWDHPTRGAVPPGDFIPLAERTGLIVPIGRWVIETACRQLAAWSLQPATKGLRLSVNVSARQFAEPGFVADIRQALAASGANPARLQLELTESLRLDDVDDCASKMRALRTVGVGFALDDFGLGHASLTCLKRLPLDELKIDRSFVRDVATDANDAAIVRTVIGMANALGMRVLAEGVEHAAQLEFLGRHGCTAYQGWLFGRPVPVADFEGALHARAARSARTRPRPARPIAAAA